MDRPEASLSQAQQRETLWHFLSDCPALHEVRTSWVSEIVQESPQCQLTVADIPRLILGGVQSLALLPLSCGLGDSSGNTAGQVVENS